MRIVISRVSRCCLTKADKEQERLVSVSRSSSVETVDPGASIQRGEGM